MSKRLTGLICALALFLSLSGCAAPPKEATSQIFAMDTFMTLTVYGKGIETSAEAALDQMEDYIYALENALSVTREASDIHKINTAGGESVEVGYAAAGLLDGALELCEQTGGALDVTLYPVVKAWGFTTGENRVPGQEELAALKDRVGYSAVELDGQTVTLPAGMELDLGAVAKGYTGYQLAVLLKELGFSSACLSLGGNVQTIGAKPNGDPWRVGVQDPESGNALAIVDVIDKAVVTSGNYQRYFKENGQIYGHIIDPDTLSPADSGLASVTIVADKGLYCDGLSTALFVMGLEEATHFWRQHRDFEAVFIGEDGAVTITAGLEGSFSLASGYENREVTILE